MGAANLRRSTIANAFAFLEYVHHVWSFYDRLFWIYGSEWGNSQTRGMAESLYNQVLQGRPYNINMYLTCYLNSTYWNQIHQ